MIILSHRGYWLRPTERNTVPAFSRSFDRGFGTETDLRDRGNQIVISHDPPVGGEMDLDELLLLLGRRRLPLALNIKSDGLASKLGEYFKSRTELSDAFVFDMSVPDLRQYAELGIPFFTRMSEQEQAPAFLDKASGVWLDAFSDIWYRLADIHALIERGLRVCIVSCELHGRDPLPMWQNLQTDGALIGSDKLMICTDRPEDFKRLVETG